MSIQEKNEDGVQVSKALTELFELLPSNLELLPVNLSPIDEQMKKMMSGGFRRGDSMMLSCLVPPSKSRSHSPFEHCLRNPPIPAMAAILANLDLELITHLENQSNAVPVLMVTKKRKPQPSTNDFEVVPLVDHHSLAKPPKVIPEV